MRLHTDSLRLRLERKEEEWWITDPIQAKADAAKVSDLFRSLSQDHVEVFLDEPPSDAKSLGLEPPQGEIRLGLAEEGTEATLLLGVEKKEGGIYGRRGGEQKVLVLKKDFLKELPTRVADLRDKTLLAVKREKVAQIELKSPKGQTVLKQDAGTWRMKEPEEALADQRVVEDLLWDLSSARVKEFVSDEAKDLNRYGLGEPTVTLRLLDKEMKLLNTLALNRVGKEEGAYARVGESQAVYLVEARLYEQLEKGPFDLRFRHLLRFETWDVGKMELSRNGQEIVVEKRNDLWELKKPTEGKAKYSAVIDLLNETKNLKWEKIVEEAPTALNQYNLDNPVATLALTKADGEPIGTLLLGKEEGDLVFAKLKDKPQVYGIPSQFLLALPPTAAALAE